MNDLPKSSPYEDFISENMMKSSQTLQADSDCDSRKFKKDFDDENVSSDVKDDSESEDESEIDLTTTGSPKSFVLVNGCIDFSNNNNNKSDK